MRVFLVRHGETDWNRQGRCQGITDLELNQNGFRQAEKVAEYLQDEEIDFVYSSNLQRAFQTAQVICRLHGLEVNIEENLRELDHGEFEGLTFAQIRAAYPDFIHKWREEPAELRIPGGERLVDVAKRAWNGIDRIIQRQRDDATVVVVSHNFPILAILCAVTGTHLNRYRSFRIGPCEVSHLNYVQSEGWSLVDLCLKERGPHSMITPSKEKR
jgi:broad specificity phosphatase PhoE